MHYTRLLRYGRVYNIINEKGAGTVNKGNYRLLTINGKRVYEHRYIIEKAIGRPLPEGTVIHHINGVTTDNRLSNLRVCNSQGEHLSIHRAKKED